MDGLQQFQIIYFLWFVGAAAMRHLIYISADTDDFPFDWRDHSFNWELGHCISWPLLFLVFQLTKKLIRAARKTQQKPKDS